jgi:signal transduction histidine kinase
MRNFYSILFIFIATALHAQDLAQYVYFEPLFVEGGTRYDPILSIAQDKEGFMWFGSTDGLHHYNGYGFRSYRKELNNPNSLIDNNIESLFVAQSGKLWVGTTFYGAMYFTYATNQFTYVPFPDNFQGKTGILQINETLEDSVIWLTGQNKTLFYREPGGAHLKKFVLEELHANCLQPLAAGGMIVGSKGYFFVIKNKKVAEKVPIAFDGIHYKSTDVLALAIDAEKRLWIGTHYNGLFVYDLSSKKFVKHYPKDKSLFFEQEILRLNFDNQGYLWIKDNDKGIIRFNPRTEQAHRFKHEPGQPGSISQNNVRSFFQDDSGIIWMGSNAGINKYDRFKRKFKHYFHNPLNPTSLSDNMIRGFYQTSDGKIWIATYDGKINVLSPDSDELVKIPVLLDDAPAGKLVYAFSFAELPDGKLLVGMSEGLAEYNPKTSRWKKIEIKGWDKSRFSDNIRQILQLDNDHYLLISNGVVYEYNHADQSIYRYAEWMKLTPPFETIHRASYLFKDPQEEIVWIGMYGRLGKFDLKTRTLTILPLFKSYDSDFMVMAAERTENHLWLTTFNAGVLKIALPFNGELENITYLTQESGLPHQTVYGIIRDASGYLWMSTNKGIARHEPESGLFLNFSNDHGVQELEFNRLAFLKLQSGEFLFGGVNGFNRFHPEDISHNPNPHFPKIISLRVLNEFSETDQNANITYPLIGKTQIELNHKQNFITFQFTSTQFSSPKLNSYYYQLKGYNKDWVFAGNSNEATFTGLQPGTYTLQVRSINPDGMESSQIASIVLKINGPFWMEWWFITLLILGISSLVGGLVYGKIRTTRKQQEFLENEVKKRTFELKESKEQLARLNEKKDLIFSILAHDIRSPLNTLKGYLDILYDHYGEIPAEEVKKHLESIKGSIGTSIDLLDNTLYWSLSQMDSIKCTPSKIDMERMVRKVRGLYDLSLTRKQLTLETHFDRTPVAVWADENMVNIILRNLLSNAIKFTPEKNEIRIEVHVNEINAHISVIDSGIGMSEEAMQSLFQSDGGTIQRGTSNEKGTGLGLVLCRNFTQMNNGSIHVKSTPNKGTTFTVVLPLA